ARSERPDFLVPAEADFTDLVLESFSKASALAPRRWIIDSTPEAFGVVDEQRLTQALLQLAANSVDYTDESDTIAFGGRIAGEAQNRIFERFARAKRTRHGRQGTGLGLTIVDRIAKAHGGSVTVSSVQGEGATFLLRLPWHREERETS